jgi:hypothetical protein
MITAAAITLALAQRKPDPAWVSLDPLLPRVASLEPHLAYPSRWFLLDRNFVVAPSRVPESVRELAARNVAEAFGDLKVSFAGRHTTEEDFDDVLVAKTTVAGETVHIASEGRTLTLLIEGRRTTTLQAPEVAMRLANAAIERLLKVPKVGDADLSQNLREHDANFFTGSIYRVMKRIVEEDGRVRFEGKGSWDSSFHIATDGRSLLVVVQLPNEGAGQQGARISQPHVCSLVPRN